MPFAGKLPKNHFGHGRDMSAAGESARTFGDFHIADFAGPIVEVAKKPGMQGLQMGEVQASRQRVQRESKTPPSGQGCFGLAQFLGITNAQAIAQDAGRRVNVAIRAVIAGHGQTAAGPPAPSPS